MTVKPRGNPTTTQGSGAVTPPQEMTNAPYTPPDAQGESTDPLNTLKIPPMPDDGTMFGPGVGQSFEEYADDIPEEVKGFFAEHDLDTRKFNCKLLVMPEGTVEGRAEYIRSWSQAFPSEEWITKNYGPGEYVLVFSWRGKVEGALKDKTHTKRAYITISERNRDIYEKHIFDKYIAETKDKKNTIRRERMKARFEREVDPFDLEDREKPQPPPPQDPKAYVREIMEMATMMGINRTPEKKVFDLDGIVKAIAAVSPIAIALIGKLGNGGLVNMLLEQSQKHNTTMVDLIKAQQGKDSGSGMMKEIREMVVSSLDIKEALNGEKDSSVDRVMETILKFAPAIAMVLSSRGQGGNNPLASQMISQAKNHIASDPDFQNVAEDSKKIVQLIAGLDEQIGWEQCDAVIAVGGIERPEAMPRDPSKRYPAGDPRNAVETESKEQDPEQPEISPA